MNDVRTPSYLLKFVSEYSHAIDLLTGILFTRPAAYYISLEQQGQGDWQEATIISGMDSYKNFNMPIFCMTGVQEEVKDGIYKFDNRIIRDFQCENGYVVIIRYDDFIEKLPKFDEGKRGYLGYVDYREIKQDEELIFLIDSTGLNLRIKRPDLYYQHEYRLVFPEHLYQPTEKAILFKKYTLTNDLDKKTTKIVPVRSLPDDGCYKVLNIHASTYLTKQ